MQFRGGYTKPEFPLTKETYLNVMMFSIAGQRFWWMPKAGKPKLTMGLKKCPIVRFRGEVRQ